MAARHGKIARLPLEIREQLNTRLFQGESPTTPVPWLNALPAVQSILSGQFCGNPITEGDLSKWREGGFFDWIDRRDWLAICSACVDDAARIASTGFSAGTFLLVLTARLAVSLDRWGDNPDGPVPKHTNFHKLINTVLRIHQCELKAASLAKDRERSEKCRSGPEPVEGKSGESAPPPVSPSAEPGENPAAPSCQSSPTAPVAATHPVNPLPPSPMPAPFHIVPVKGSTLPTRAAANGKPSPHSTSPLGPAVQAALASGDAEALDAALEAQLEADLGPESYARFCAALGRQPSLHSAVRPAERAFAALAH